MGGCCCCCTRQEDFSYIVQTNERECCCCCCMLGAYSHPGEEHSTPSPMHCASPSQSAGLLNRASIGGSIPDTYHEPPRPQSFGHETGNSQVEKDTQGPLSAKTQTKSIFFTDGKTDVGEIKAKNNATSMFDDEDICATCLEGYDAENPKTNTKCGHRFHLACILEWLERSDTCPVCNKEMEFTENK